MQNVRLKDVAQAAGVSVSTVSRILDERSAPSQSDTAIRVRRAAQELGYVRNAAASSLRRRETGAIGVIVPRLSDTLMSILFEHIFAEAQRRGLFAMVSVSGDDERQVRRTADQLLARGVDALITMSARKDDSLTEYLAQTRVPHILALRSDGQTPSVCCDDALGGYLAVRHLLDLGHRSVVVMPGPEFASTAEERLRGCRKAFSELGLELPESSIVRSGFGFDSGFVAADELLPRQDRPSAIFAANDNMAHGVMLAAVNHGLRVPDQLSIVGYNDLPLAAQLPVALTTVHVPFELLAARLLGLMEEMLHARREGGDCAVQITRSVQVVPTLIPRASAIRASESGGA